MRFELAGKDEAVNFVVAYAPTDFTKNTELKHVFWQKLGVFGGGADPD